MNSYEQSCGTNILTSLRSAGALCCYMSLCIPRMADSHLFGQLWGAGPRLCLPGYQERVLHLSALILWGLFLCQTLRPFSCTCSLCSQYKNTSESQTEFKKKKTLNRGVRDKAIYVSDRATDITRWYNVSFVGSSLWNFSAVKGPFSHHHLLCHLISNLFEVVQESVTACIGTRAQKASLTL